MQWVICSAEEKGQLPSLRRSDLTNYFYLVQQTSSLLQPFRWVNGVCQHHRSGKWWETASFCFERWRFLCSLPLLGGSSQNRAQWNTGASKVDTGRTDHSGAVTKVFTSSQQSQGPILHKPSSPYAPGLCDCWGREGRWAEHPPVVLPAVRASPGFRHGAAIRLQEKQYGVLRQYFLSVCVWWVLLQDFGAERSQVLLQNIWTESKDRDTRGASSSISKMLVSSDC